MFATNPPEDCRCGWLLEHGATLWERTIRFADCPRHGWLDVTCDEVGPLLEWLRTGWWTVDAQPTEPIRGLLREIDAGAVRGHVPTRAGKALGELLAGEWMPFDMLPHIRRLLAAEPLRVRERV